MEALEGFLAATSDFLWGLPLITLIVGGGLFFLIYSRGLPYRHFAFRSRSGGPSRESSSAC